MESHRKIPAQPVPYRFAAPSRRRITLSCGATMLWVLALAFTPAVYAATDRWTPFGHGDGRLQSLVATTRGELYVTSSFTAGEIWQRPAPGAAWRWRGLGLGYPRVTALAVHPKNPDALWAVSTGSGGTVFQSVFRSTDAGATWRKLYTGDVDFQVFRLTVATARGSVVLLAETGGSAAKRLLRSSDAGASWTRIAGAIGPVAAPPDEPGTVYAVSGSGDGLVKSTDNGRTFRPTGALPIAAGDEVLTLHTTSGRPALVFASLRTGGLYRSTNGGATFRLVGFERAGPSALASGPGDSKIIYAGNFGALYESDRSGQGGSFRLIAGLSFQLIGAPSAIAATQGGLYFLSNGYLRRFVPVGDSTVDDLTGIEAFGIAELRISPADPSFIVLRRHTGCIREICDIRTLLSTDGGATFTRLGWYTSPRRFSDVFDLAFDPAEPQRRLMVGPVAINLTEPSGLRMVRYGFETTVEIAAEGVLLAGGPDGIVASEDDGATWATAIGGILPPDPLHPLGGTRRFIDLETNPYASERVIARAVEKRSGGLPDPGRIAFYKSADAGRSWNKLRDGEADVEFIPGEPDSLFLLFASPAGTELRRSDDFGATSALIHVFPFGDQVNDVATDPNAPGHLYAATRLGVLRSRDGGANWEATAGGFAPFGSYRRSLGRVQVAPDQAGRLFALPLDGGLFENRLSD